MAFGRDRAGISGCRWVVDVEIDGIGFQRVWKRRMLSLDLKAKNIHCSVFPTAGRSEVRQQPPSMKTIQN